MKLSASALPASISPAIIDGLYGEALSLAEEARMAFIAAGAPEPAGEIAGAQRIALSCEALRTTTRMMQALAWLLNHRAFFAGELSEFQLRRHGRLPSAQPITDAAQLALLDTASAKVSARSHAFYARIERLDHNWRDQFTQEPRTIEKLRDQLGVAFSGR